MKRRPYKVLVHVELTYEINAEDKIAAKVYETSLKKNIRQKVFLSKVSGGFAAIKMKKPSIIQIDYEFPQKGKK